MQAASGGESPNSLYSMKVVMFEEDQVASDQFDAQGFIKLNALRLRLGASAGGAAGRCRQAGLRSSVSGLRCTGRLALARPCRRG
jgi:hypothetical protein